MRSKLLVLVLILSLIGALGISPAAADPAPQAESLTLDGLSAPVTVQYDGFGVPHIYASTSADLMMAQGFIHAQDRWWQMEYFRHQGRGELAALLGEGSLNQDILFRTIGLHRLAAQDLAIAAPEVVSALEHYAAGVNAWISDKSAAELAIEYDYLGIPDFEIRPWEPLDTMVLVQSLSLDQEGSDLNFELIKAGVIEAAGEMAAFVLLPGYPYNRRPIITEPGFQASSAPDTIPNTTFDPSNLQAVPELPQRFALMQGIGSNSWAVSGALTDSGVAYLANDPHIGIQMPPIWYQNGLHCVEVSPDCPYDVYGYSFASSPMVVLGHNQNIAWGWTNSGLDSIDIYRLKLNPDDILQYEVDGEYVDMELIPEIFNIRDAEPLYISIRMTRFGPYVSDAIGFPDQPMAVRWVAFEPSGALDSVHGINVASNWDEFTAAAASFPIGQNMLYADVHGNIGLVAAGRIPIRASGHDGGLPADGSTSDFDWVGFLDPSENPRIYNPEAGYIVAANNAIARPENTAALVSTYYDFGYRAERIENLIQSADVIDLDYMAMMQSDSYHPTFDFIMPFLRELDMGDADLNALRDWLGEWDGFDEADSPHAALYNVFYSHLVRFALDEYAMIGRSPDESLEVYQLRIMMNSEAHPLWDNVLLSGSPGRDAIVQLAFESAAETIVERLGADQSAWAWGDLHMARFVHNALGNSDDPQTAAFFNRSIPVGGGMSHVNRQNWRPLSGEYHLTGSIVSMRHVIDLADLNNSLFVHTLGQSGDPRSPHYDDQMPLWASGGYIDYGFSAEAVEAITHHTITLNPSE